MNINQWEQFDFSLGVQDATTFLLKKPNELSRGINLRFTEKVGGFQRRDGFVRAGNQFSGVPNLPTGGHIAKFSTGSKRFVAVNNDAGTATIIRTQDSAGGAWTTLGTISYPVNSVVFFLDYLDEVYISGFDPATGDPLTPYNVDKTLDVSATRNLFNAPKCYFFAEYLGLLYAANVMIGSDRFPDRVYKSSPPLGAVTFIQGAQTGTLTTLKVDSVRYLKAGSVIDIYTAGTDTKIYDITITSVNKATNTITVPSASYTVGDNDEIWLDGRKGKLTTLWNTDYPTPQNAEYLAIKPGTDSSNTVSAIGKSSNRLFIFTKNSGTRWDGQNLVVFNNNVGCISQRSLANIDDDWLIWVDSKGNVRARNEDAGQQENISRGIRNPWMRKLTLAQLKAVSGGVVDSVYKLYLGTINGEYIRVCYDFDANTWSPERLGHPALIQATDDYTGVLKPYFFSNNGRLYMDESGNKDDDKTIAFEAGTGRDIFQSPRRKKYVGILLFSKNCNGLKLEAAVDGGQMKTIGRIEGEVCYMPFPEQGDSKLPVGTAFDWQIMGASEGDPPEVEGAVIYFTPQEQIPSERR